MHAAPPGLPAALLAGLVLTLRAGAQTGSGRIAYSSLDGVFTVNPDGSGRTLFRAGAGQPMWSPDGSKIAYVDVTRSPGRLVVANADGTGEHTVTTGSIALGSWSPDGARLVYVRDGTKIETASAAGGDERQLVSDGTTKESPVWSPDGLRIAYVSIVEPQWELFVVGADGTGLTQLTHAPPDGGDYNADPAWSPDGSWIAFNREFPDQPQSISIVHPDGSDLHPVAYDGYFAGGQPAWSPDGTKIAFVSTRYGGIAKLEIGGEIFVVDADGSNEKRLTKLGPEVVQDIHPTWSPDGVRLLFRRSGRLATMNADGTCQSEIDDLWMPNGLSWQAVPGEPSLEPKSCHAISVAGGVQADDGLGPLSITATATNEGTEPLSGVELVVSFWDDIDLSASGACQVRVSEAHCPIGSLARGQSRQVSLEGFPRVIGADHRRLSKVSFAVVAAEPLLETYLEEDHFWYPAKRCSTKDPGSGLISGTPARDRVCGRRGADRIAPGPGRDWVYAGAGPDVIFATDGSRDWISCGPGRDTVKADRKDHVARDCERVRRVK